MRMEMVVAWSVGKNIFRVELKQAYCTMSSWFVTVGKAFSYQLQIYEYKYYKTQTKLNILTSIIS